MIPLQGPPSGLPIPDGIPGLEVAGELVGDLLRGLLGSLPWATIVDVAMGVV